MRAPHISDRHSGPVDARTDPLIENALPCVGSGAGGEEPDGGPVFCSGAGCGLTGAAGPALSPQAASVSVATIARAPTNSLLGGSHDFSFGCATADSSGEWRRAIANVSGEKFPPVHPAPGATPEPSRAVVFSEGPDLWSDSPDFVGAPSLLAKLRKSKGLTIGVPPRMGAGLSIFASGGRSVFRVQYARRHPAGRTTPRWAAPVPGADFHRGQLQDRAWQARLPKCRGASPERQCAPRAPRCAPKA